VHRFFICDVFTDTRFGGNPLAVIPDARGLSGEQMQRIAREFGFSETTFVLPAEAGHTRRVRIFTPTVEIPFAGHPNIGTAWVLANSGAFGDLGETTRVVFEELAGLVPITIDSEGGRPTRCELAAPESLSVGRTVPVERTAAAAGIAAEDIRTANHPPQVASVGLPFVFAELCDRSALARARPDLGVLEGFEAEGLPHGIHLYTPGDEGFDLRARMFVPLDGVPEDPATGSANCALVALLASLDTKPDGEFRWKIAQGVEMGRPSTLFASAVKRGGEVVEARIAGDCVLVAEGEMMPERDVRSHLLYAPRA
jgi:trans-2,3-dihydro-3-hydroxyanthranilate isomerase